MYVTGSASLDTSTATGGTSPSQLVLTQ
jgi:hypothetical protein